jgi:hypothetical protein
MFQSTAGRTVIRGRKLYRTLVAGVMLVLLAVGGLVYWGVHEVRRDAAAAAVESSARGLAGAVTVLVNAVASSSADMNVADLDSLAAAELRPSFSAIMTRHANLAAVMVSDADGLRYLLARRSDGLLETVAAGGRVESRTLWLPDGSAHTAVTGGRQPDAELNRALAEEYRHLQPGQVNWRSADRVLDEGESWLAASSLAESGQGRVMISFVFPVDAVVSQLDGAEKGRAEKVFLFWDSGMVLPIGDTAAGEAGGRAPRAAAAVSDPVVAGAAGRLADDPSLKGVPVPVRAAGETWWVYLTPLSVFGDTLSLGVAVPVSEVTPALGSDSFLQGFGGGLALLMAGALYLLRRYRTRIEALGMRHGAARMPDDILRLIAEGESGGLEFKQTMRFNLKAGKNGKEIEHAIAKTVAAFINSEGGTLLVGVADDGTVTGFAEDGFASDDKALLHFNNLVNQYIGAEFARYVDTIAIEVRGRAVIRALCTPASAPAILRNGQSEEFYVRSGPASRQLSLSQFHEWLQNH